MFFGVQREERAARSVYGTLVNALAYFEEAGEVPKPLRLSSSAGLSGAAKEFEAKRRLLAEALGEATSKKQALPLVLALLEALEKVVVDDSIPLYVRAYNWYRLMRHWASIRFSDTAGLPPGTLSRRARGLTGSLTQTKTSGADKSAAVLPIFISRDAWIGTEWLDTGLSIWQNELGYPRDYFLPLPNNDFSGSIGKRARYSDAVGFSRSLLGMLVDDEGEKLLEPESICFWSEHSDRAGLDSWLAAMSVGSDVRRFVGRWAVKNSEDGYV